jgi:mannose-6-phosphate isomerase-like protein (cupin superfamily)
MNNIQGKVWGETECLFFKNNVEIHRIEANKDHHCSKHKHEHKFNAFFIEKGKLKITTWKNDYDLVDETIITDKQMSIVKPGEYHRFEALEDTVAYEIYWTEMSQSDIVREDHGGKND